MANSVIGASSYAEVLRRHAEEDPERQALSFLSPEGEVTVTLTYGEIDQRARAIAAALWELGSPGERALLFLPPGPEFAIAFLACLHAKLVAVPAEPPHRRRGLGRALAVIEDARPRWILSTGRAESKLRESIGERGRGLRWLAVDGVDWGRADGFQGPRVEPDTVAFLQYTSGSTSTPKGVMVTHGNLLHNQRMIQSAFGTSIESTVIGWLPLYHDMGLIGNLLQPLFLGARTVLMSPMTFVQNPLRWLEAISRFRGTTSGGPNFGYELCLRRISDEQLAGLDLSSWRVAFCGAEPVREETLERFARKFSSAGFRRKAFFPCYGLAETTLFVSGPRAHEGAAVLGVDAKRLEEGWAERAEGGSSDVRRLVSCGQTGTGHQVAIVNPETARSCKEHEVGEIWVAGPSVARGYWQREVESATVFGASMVGDDGTRFLRTGDLGFVQRGELYITGRLKDLIILRGRNYYPQDLELTAERSGEDLRPGCGAAFSVDVAGEERLVVVQEVKRHPEEDVQKLVERVRQRIAEEHEVSVYEVVLVRLGGVPKTSSGKVRRQECRHGYLDDLLPVVARSLQAVADPQAPIAPQTNRLHSLPRQEAQQLLVPYLVSQAARWARVAVEQVNRQAPLGELGLDSVAAAGWGHTLESELGVRLPLAQLLYAPRAEELASRILQQLTDRGSVGSRRPVPQAMGEEWGDHPASYGQQALWFENQRAPERCNLHLDIVSRLQGPLEVEVLRRSLERLTARHGALRTTLIGVEGKPVQRVHQEMRPDFRVVQAEGLSEEEQQELLDVEVQKPFDLEVGPLMRMAVYDQGNAEWIVQWTVHHLVADLRSLEILGQELGQLIAAALEGKEANLEPLSLRYSDFCRWQEALLEGLEGKRMESTWRQCLAGADGALELPTDRLRNPGSRQPGGSRSRWLGEVAVSGALQLGRERGTTLFVTLLAAWQGLLHRMTGKRDLTVGCPSSGRVEPEFANLVGYFVNPLVLRSQLSEEPCFETLLKGASQRLTEALEAQEFPFARLAERLGVSPAAERTPLFQTLFVLQRAQDPSWEGMGGLALGLGGSKLQVGPLALESVARVPVEVQFDLTLMVAELEGRIAVSLHYDRSLFDVTTVDRLLGHFQVLLEEAITAPQQKLSKLGLLSVAERHQLRREWNDTASPGLAVPVTLPALFARQAACTPDAVALSYGGEQQGGGQRLSYECLALASTRLAHRLKSHGVGPETTVGVCLERGVALVVALLATLKAGGAYVPLAPTDPAERLALMAVDTCLTVLLTNQTLAASFPPIEATKVLLDDDGNATPDAFAHEDEGKVKLSAGNLAYVIYTSGSTGRPKGAMNSHAALINRLLWMQDTYRLNSGDRVLQKTPFSFDVSVWEFFWPLLTGSELVMARPGGHLDSAWMVGEIVRSRVTTLHFVPPVLSVFLDERGLGACHSLRRVIASGETLSSELVDRFHIRLPEVELHNLYGPTEAAIDVTVWPCTGKDSPLPIGRPIANLRIHVLDRGGRVVPIGTPGELHIAGLGLARGYHRCPALTAMKFVPDPFAQRAGERLYRSGDLACFRADGAIEFLGRWDDQVKIRGFRVELGEIEATLRQHPAVEDAVLRVQDAAAEVGGVLVAYLVAATGGRDEEEPGAPGAATLRAFLGALLPAHMVPSIFIVLEDFPRTAHGKIDRKTLPKPTPQDGGANEGPQGMVEEVLATIWEETLNSTLSGEEVPRRIGRDEDFFALGGHSLLATRVLSRIYRDLEVQLAVQDIFDAPTLRQLAGRVASARQPEGGEELAPIEPAPRDQPLPLSFGQHRLWVLEQLELGGAAYHIPVALELLGRLDRVILAHTLQEILWRHEVLRTRFVVRDGRPTQVVSEPEAVRLPIWDLSALASKGRDQELHRRSVAFARLPFDLETATPLRAALVYFTSNRHLLLITVHHLAFDGWSGAIFAHELAQIYAALLAGLPSPLPELPVQYADFAAAQRRTDVPERQLVYWTQQLFGAPAVLELPTDRPRPANLSHRGGRSSRALSPRLSAEIRALSRRQGVTPFMTHLAVFYLLLERYSGQGDLCVGTPVAHRQRPELEELIGFFVSTLVLRADLNGGPSFSEFLGQVRRMTLDAFDHRDLPFEQLVEELQLERNLNHHPLFQVFFVFHNEPSPQFALPGLNIRCDEVPSGFAKFDLTLTLREAGEDFVATLGYRSELYDAATAVRLLVHFENLLSAVTKTPRQRLKELPMLSRGERWQLAGEWASNRRCPAPEACLHELVEAWGEHRGDAIAVISGAVRLSYRAINDRADQLARNLQQLGVGPEQVVGVAVQRSTEMLVAVLGILKAGGAYLPLSEQLPAQRQSLMLQDAEVEILLTGGQALDLPGFQGVTFSLEDGWETSLAAGGWRPLKKVGPGNASYVIYTSGTTGRPKGVVVEHRQVVNYLWGIAEKMRLRPGMEHVLMQPIAVDASIAALFGSLTTGGCLHIFNFEQATDALWIADYFANHAIDCLKLAPSHLAALHRASKGTCVLPRHRLLLGGEAANSEWIDALQSAAGPRCEIYNQYGPTEATVAASVYRVVPRSLRPGSLEIPIGRPLSNCRSYVLDQHLRPVPTGVPGQLYLGGRGVARGYLRRPAGSAAVLIPDHLGPEPGARLYRTGDCAKWLSDGNLQFLGRLDRQLKIRGFRVEPGEVEGALNRLSHVRQAVVSTWQEGDSIPRLVAYVVPAPGFEFSAAELREDLLSKLPSFMVPSVLVPLAELPRTAHGKLDLKALPAPRSESTHRQPVAPGGAVQQRLAEIWAEVLGVEEVSMEDNFFELGGDSILSIQIVAEASRSGIRLSPKQIFKSRNLAEAALGARLETPTEAEQGPVVGLVPLTPIEHWFFEQEPIEPHHFNQAVLLEVDSELETSFLSRALAVVISHHDALRLRFERRGSAWRQSSEAAEVLRVFGVVDLSQLRAAEGGERMRRAVNALHAHLDLGVGPLIRAARFHLAEPLGDRLLIVVHHLAIDGVSWRVLLADLVSACHQISKQGEVALPAKSTSFKRWAEKLGEYAHSPALDAELTIWRDWLEGASTPLPVDFSTGNILEGNTYDSLQTVTVHLHREETTALLREVPSAYRVHLDEILLAALACVLRHFTGASSLLVDIESHGREELFEDFDLSRTVGWFTAIFPLRLDLAAADDISTSVRSVKERLRQVPNGGIGFGIARYLAAAQIREPLIGAPTPQVKFNYLGQLDSALTDSSPFRLAEESSGTARSPRARRSHLFDLVARVSGQRFQLEWMYSRQLHKTETVQLLAEGFLAALREILDRRQAPDLDVCTPADFPLAAVSQDDLEGALAEFEFEVD